MGQNVTPDDQLLVQYLSLEDPRIIWIKEHRHKSFLLIFCANGLKESLRRPFKKGFFKHISISVKRLTDSHLSQPFEQNFFPLTQRCFRQNLADSGQAVSEKMHTAMPLKYWTFYHRYQCSTICPSLQFLSHLSMTEISGEKNRGKSGKKICFYFQLFWQFTNAFWQPLWQM